MRPRFGGAENELAGMIGIPRGVLDCDIAAIGMSEHDRFVDLERTTQRRHIVRPPIDAPSLRRGRITSSGTAQIGEDQLGDIGEPRQK